MARENIKDASIDNALVFAYSKVQKLADLENFISGPNSVDFPRVGDRCYDEKLYEAAKLLFIATKNNAKIASCLVRLKQFQQAIDAAKKANTPKTWKELTMACVEAAEFKLAAVSGLNIIIHPDHLEELT
jgi:clathrin heavy chain